MKTLWLSLLGKVIQYLTSKKFVDLVKQFVFTMFNEDKLSGEEKRKYVLNELKKQNQEFGLTLTNLAIESVVTIAKVKGVNAIKPDNIESEYNEDY